MSAFSPNNTTRHPDLTPENTRAALYALAEDLQEPGFDARSGWGLLPTELVIPDRLPALLRAPLSAAKAAVDAAPPRMRASLLAGCSGPQARLPELCGRLESGLRNSLAAKNRALSEASGKLSVLGPESSFRRGWSVTTDSAGKLVRAEDARPGMEIVTRLAGGTIRSKVESSRTAQSSAG